MNVKLADGSHKLEPVQMCTVDVGVKGRCILTRFIVFPKSTETLLGIEFDWMLEFVLIFMKRFGRFMVQQRTLHCNLRTRLKVKLFLNVQAT